MVSSPLNEQQLKATKKHGLEAPWASELATYGTTAGERRYEWAWLSSLMTYVQITTLTSWSPAAEKSHM